MNDTPITETPPKQTLFKLLGEPMYVKCVKDGQGTIVLGMPIDDMTRTDLIACLGIIGIHMQANLNAAFNRGRYAATARESGALATDPRIWPG